MSTFPNKRFYFSIFFLIVLFLLPIGKVKAESEKTPLYEKILYYLYQPITLFLPHIELRETIYEKESQYFNIRVEKDEIGRRHLVFLPRRGSQSILDPENPNKVISNFMKHAFLSLLILKKEPKNALFIGMGGGIMPRYIRDHYKNTCIDIVEIDPAIPDIAEKFFAFKPDKNMNIHIVDGRVFINKATEKYDLIFMDVYNAENIPFQFTTKDFFEQVRDRLSNDGIFVANIANLGRDGFISAELNTIRQVFNNCFVSVCEGDTNYVPFATQNNINMKDIEKKVKNSNFSEKDKYDINFVEIYSSILSPEGLNNLIGPSPVVLTDDYAPVNLL